VRRLALVRPHGIFGMTVAGFFEVIRVAYPVAVFPDLRAATSWLGANELAEILDTRVRDAMEAGPVARALRSWLDVHLAEASLEACAHALAQSPRSLQRHLQLIGRTFRGELQAARVRAAKRLLLDSRENLTTIAFEVGCASLQHLSQLFRRHEGRSPSSWRQEARARHR
jgi:transcriptional regulator GlxA family with amidase domain